MLTSGHGSAIDQLTSRVPNRCRRLRAEAGPSPKLCCVSVRQDQNCCRRAPCGGAACAMRVEDRGRDVLRLEEMQAAGGARVALEPPRRARLVHDEVEGDEAGPPARLRRSARSSASMAGWSTRSKATATVPRHQRRRDRRRVPARGRRARGCRSCVRRPGTRRCTTARLGLPAAAQPAAPRTQRRGRRRNGAASRRVARRRDRERAGRCRAGAVCRARRAHGLRANRRSRPCRAAAAASRAAWRRRAPDGRAARAARRHAASPPRPARPGRRSPRARCRRARRDRRGCSAGAGTRELRATAREAPQRWRVMRLRDHDAPARRAKLRAMSSALGSRPSVRRTVRLMTSRSVTRHMTCSTGRVVSRAAGSHVSGASTRWKSKRRNRRAMSSDASIVREGGAGADARADAEGDVGARASSRPRARAGSGPGRRRPGRASRRGAGAAPRARP